MTPTDAQIEAAARSDAAFDGRGWEAMARTDRDRYLARSRAALEAAERAAWRPVSEAPKDGTPVLVCGAENRPDKMDVAEWHYWANGHCYCWATEGALNMQPLDPPPTHFRPLPAPPEGPPA